VEKVYRVDVFGFLIDSSEWDKDFAANRAYEMGLSEGLTEKHWEIIHFLRNKYQESNIIPTVYECCESNQIDLEKLGALFPAGYHCGALKIAGLRLR